jgi:hypothetical protein
MNDTPTTVPKRCCHYIEMQSPSTGKWLRFHALGCKNGAVTEFTRSEANVTDLRDYTELGDTGKERP